MEKYILIVTYNKPSDPPLTRRHISRVFWAADEKGSMIFGGQLASVLLKDTEVADGALTQAVMRYKEATPDEITKAASVEVSEFDKEFYLTPAN